MQARFYVPWYHKFASPDPGLDQQFEETQSWNIYSYCLNNPVMSTDPTGMFDKEMIKRSLGLTPKNIQAAKDFANGIKEGAVSMGNSLANMVGLGSSSNGGNVAEYFQKNSEAHILGRAAFEAVPFLLPMLGEARAAKTVGGAAEGAEVLRAATTGAEQSVNQTMGVMKWDSNFAAQQWLGGSNVTPGGLTISAHAAERMVAPGPGRATMSMAEVDQVVQGATRVKSVDFVHPQGPTITLQNQNMIKKPQVVLDLETQKRVVTTIKNN